MSVYVPDPPTFSPVIEEEKKGTARFTRFNKQWLGWFVGQNRAIRDLQSSFPINSQIMTPSAGPGPVSVTCNFTMRRPGNIVLVGTAVQTWVTAQPTWQVQAKVDGAVVWDSGAALTIWQIVASMSVAKSLPAGAHSAQLIWSAANANATLQSIVLNVFQAYTS